jgi:hypothetical protein
MSKLALTGQEFVKLDGERYLKRETCARTITRDSYRQ